MTAAISETRLREDEIVAEWNLERDHLPEAVCVRRLAAALAAAEAKSERAEEERDLWTAAVQEWEDAYPIEVFPWGGKEELQHAMALVNAEDPNQSARLYAEWGRHISRCIRERVAAASSSGEGGHGA